MAPTADIDLSAVPMPLMIGPVMLLLQDYRCLQSPEAAVSAAPKII